MVCDKTRAAQGGCPHGGRAVSAPLSIVPVMKSGRVTTHDANNPASGCHAPRERATNVANADFAHIRLDSTLLRLSSVVPAQAGLLAQPWAGASGWWRKIVAAILIGIFQTRPRPKNVIARRSRGGVTDAVIHESLRASSWRGWPRHPALVVFLAMTQQLQGHARLMRKRLHRHGETVRRWRGRLGHPRACQGNRLVSVATSSRWRGLPRHDSEGKAAARA